MVDISAIAGAMSALNAATNITKAMIGLRDTKIIQTKVIELNTIILQAQAAAFSANQERAALVERIGQLEKEIANLKAWETDKQRYELTDIGDGNFAYTAKVSMRGSEQPHYICANCYQLGKTSILQHMHLSGGGDLLTCSGCNAKTLVARNYKPPLKADD